MHHVSQANHTYNSLTVLDKEEFRTSGQFNRTSTNELRIGNCQMPLHIMHQADAVCTVHSPDGSTFLHEMMTWPPS